MHRRTFLGQTGLALALGSSTLRAAGTGMTFGFSTYGMKTLKTERAIEVIGEVGFDSVEINIWRGWDADSANLSPARRRSIRQALEDNGVRLTGFMEKWSNSEKDQRAVLDGIRRAGDLGRDLSPRHQPVLQSTLSGKTWEEMKEVFLRQLEAWVKVADESKIVIAIKPHRGGALSRPSEAVWLIEKLGKPKWLRLCYDYSHYAFRDMPMAETIKTALPYTAHIAIKDAVQQDGRVRFANPGTAGTIDYGNLLRQFYEGGYRGDVCCEVSGQVWNAKGYDPVASAKQCYKSISPAFRKAKVPRG